jgi:hypothetical protein
MEEITQYTLEDFNNITFDGFDYSIPQEIIDIINNISEQVGAPSYNKTPNFQKNEHQSKYKKKRRGQIVSDEDWEVIRNFQTTKIEKKEGIDKHIESIRKHLNKITEISYDIHKTGIISIIQELDQKEFLDEDKIKIGESIFIVASGNAFYSSLYAKLYKELMDNYDFMRSIFTQNLDKFTQLFDTINYCSPDVDYNRFCEINKENDKRKATSNFYVNLMKEGVLSKVMIIDLIIKFQGRINNLIDQEDKTSEVEELSENIFIMVFNSCEEIEGDKRWKNIKQNITQISKITFKEYPSISNKVIFKHMDLLDHI